MLTLPEMLTICSPSPSPSLSLPAGTRYVLPLNAAMRIGFEQPNQPPTYYNIVDIINASDPPKLISPCSNYHGSEGNSLKMNEVLQVKGVHVARVRRAKSLLVVNIKTEEEKKIPSDCPISFSTEPTSNQVSGWAWPVGVASGCGRGSVISMV